MHPLIPKLRQSLSQGRISRREFLRLATLVGLSLAGAQSISACVQPEPPASPTPAPSTKPAQASFIRGGVLQCATRIERVDHPARFTRLSQSHPWRHVLEYLTCLSSQGLAVPYLLEKWAASADLLTWTLNIRQGVRFNNGQELTAADVIFNFNQWLDKDLNSAMSAALSFLDASGIERADDYTVVLRLKEPTIFLPELLCQFPAAVVPRNFGGDLLRQPLGTGAFTMQEYTPGERCRLTRRNDYWRNGQDGKPLPYLDQIVMLQFGQDRAADLPALQTGQVDAILEPPFSFWEVVQDDPRLTVVSIPTAAAYLLRMRVDQPPWKDNRVRQALKYCHDRPKILSAVLQGQGTIGHDSHIAPAQPEYTPLEAFPFDPGRAKSLLSEAGHPDGLSVEIAVPSDWPVALAYAQALQQDASAGGFQINLKTMPAADYWANWTEWNCGITWWAHRPQASMLLPLAYSAGADGSPAPWNETRWVDQEFGALLHQAEKTLDLSRRKEIVHSLQLIQKERGSICTPFFTNVWQIYDKRLHGIVASPDEYASFYETWKET